MRPGTFSLPSPSPVLLSRPSVRLVALTAALRPVQWSKNVPVFLTLLLAHQYSDPARPRLDR